MITRWRWVVANPSTQPVLKRTSVFPPGVGRQGGRAGARRRGRSGRRGDAQCEVILPFRQQTDKSATGVYARDKKQGFPREARLRGAAKVRHPEPSRALEPTTPPAPQSLTILSEVPARDTVPLSPTSEGSVCDIQLVTMAMVLSTAPIFNSGTDMAPRPWPWPHPLPGPAWPPPPLGPRGPCLPAPASVPACPCLPGGLADCRPKEGVWGRSSTFGCGSQLWLSRFAYKPRYTRPPPWSASAGTSNRPDVTAPGLRPRGTLHPGHAPL